VIRVVLPPHLRTLARVDGDVELDDIPCCAGRCAITSLSCAGHSSDFLPVEKIYLTNRQMLRCRNPLQRDLSRL
jgi:hypothetical protein